jgi:hypothetical protein
MNLFDGIFILLAAFGLISGGIAFMLAIPHIRNPSVRIRNPFQLVHSEEVIEHGPVAYVLRKTVSPD